jgi:hypothetical protein
MMALRADAGSGIYADHSSISLIFKRFVDNGKLVAIHVFLVPSQFFLPAGPFQCPAVVCACGLGFSPDAPLSSGAGIGGLSYTALKFLDSHGKYAKNQ